jgi:hypothetical protein
MELCFVLEPDIASAAKSTVTTHPEEVSNNVIDAT